MSEKNLNFDEVIDRTHTNSLKYDCAARRGMPEGLLPLWVADMDFRISSYIQEDLKQLAEHGIFGYSEPEESYFKAVAGWMKSHHDWEVDRRWLVKTPGVVFALAMAVQAYTKPGDGVLIQQPVYYPFSEVIRDNGRRLVNSPLVQDDTGRYGIDFQDFERQIVSERVKLFLLCSPHNPVGRVWTEEELRRIGEICKEHQVIVVSDEIHADFAFCRKHTVFSTVKDEFADFSIICTAPSKTFNLAGLQISNIFIPNRELRHLFKGRIVASGYSQLNASGLTACESAYTHGEEWYQAVRTYIRENAVRTRAFLAEHLPKVSMTELEGTYLVWLDFRTYNLTDSELERRIVKEAGLWLDGGSIFGRDGQGFQRINIACPWKTLELALQKLADVF